jgi:hypothetical protein
VAGPDNAELLRQLARSSAGGEYDAEAERDLVRAIADATLLVPMREDPETGRPGLWATTDEAGQTQFLAFTDPGALEAWVGGPAPYALIPGVELAVIAAGADAAALWINASGPHGGRLDRRMVAVVAAGRTMDLEVEKGNLLRLRTTGVGELHVRAPEPPEPEALEALRAAVAAAPVAGAWLLEATVPPPTHLVLVLEVDAGESAELDGVREAARRLVPPDRFIDVMPLSGDDEVVARGREVGLSLAP